MWDDATIETFSSQKTRTSIMTSCCCKIEPEVHEESMNTWRIHVYNFETFSRILIRFSAKWRLPWKPHYLFYWGAGVNGTETNIARQSILLLVLIAAIMWHAPVLPDCTRGCAMMGLWPLCLVTPSHAHAHMDTGVMGSKRSYLTPRNLRTKVDKNVGLWMFI